MTMNEKLDSILFFIKKKTDLGASINAKYIWNLYVERTPELEIEQLLFQDILDHLVNDGYLSKRDGVYHLTVNGRAFRGYVHSNKFWVKYFNFTFKQWVLIGTITTVIGGLIVWWLTTAKKT
jgi:hypothetical protein